ncbi:MAG TPA: inositol monophosphatase family protein [Sphingomicrobium sp.]|nr:inositol monophosphatase family protein [Sphingomicrobium sp.]
MDTAKLIAFALELAKAARAQTLARWESGCPAENKATDGFDPVTEADRAAEQVMRELIAEHFPDHGVTGEEWPDHQPNSERVWSLDPIDGTRSFICGLPTWVTLIAFLDKGAPAIGLIDAPCLDETYIGYEGRASMWRENERKPIHASSCSRLAEARISTTDPFLFDEHAREVFDRLRRGARTVRYGFDGYAYARLAAGHIDLVVEGGLKPHDYNALIPLVSAAGGVIGDWRGGGNFNDGNVIAAATPALFAEAVAYFDALA